MREVCRDLSVSIAAGVLASETLARSATANQCRIRCTDIAAFLQAGNKLLSNSRIGVQNFIDPLQERLLLCFCTGTIAVAGQA